MLRRPLVAPVVLLALLALLALPVPVSGAVTATRTGGPSYTWTSEPSPVVLLLPGRRVRLRPVTYCWEAPPTTTPGGELGSALCADGVEPPRARLPKVVRTGAIRFWFGRPGWRWSARVTSFAHPRRAGCDVLRAPKRASAQRFDLAPPKRRGTYRVQLYGHGPEGDVAVTFSWRHGKRAGRCS